MRWPDARRGFLTLSVALNLGVLAFYKYAGFLFDQVAMLRGGFAGDGVATEPLVALLPLGISFYTFQAMSYTIDVYRGVRPFHSLTSFATYLSFFPQLVSGPIVRMHEMAPQLATPRTLEPEAAVRGIHRIGIGMVKKVVIADGLAVLVEPVFAAPLDHTPFANTAALYGYAFQIFFDFSGYCDIAIGCALLFGFRLPENFDRPYLTPDIATFWRRWHMTLSSWLRDYLYIPLGGNRRGIPRTYVNLMITMLLGGLWHGASWNFVIWGGLHGLFLAVHRAFRAQRPLAAAPGRLRDAFNRCATFNLVVLAWIFFRSPTFDKALEMASQVARSFVSGEALELAAVWLAAPALLVCYAALTGLREALVARCPNTPLQGVAWGTALAAGLLVLAWFAAPPAQFVYFAF